MVYRLRMRHQGNVRDVLDALEGVAFADLFGSFLAVGVDGRSLVSLLSSLSELVLVSILESLKVFSGDMRVRNEVVSLLCRDFIFLATNFFRASSFLRSRALAPRLTANRYI